MLPSYRELILDSPITRLSEGKDGILSATTQNHEIYFIDLITLKVLRKIPLSHEEVIEEFDYYKRSIVVNDELAYAKLLPDSKEFILDVSDKLETKFIFNYTKNERISKASFSPDNTLLITGSEKGKTNLIDATTGALIYDFPFASDTISAVRISEDKLYALSASFDKSLRILHVNSLSVSEELKLDGVIEKLYFIDLGVFLAITRDGRVLKIDAKSRKILAQINLPNGLWPSELRVSHSKAFSYIGTRESHLIAIFNETFEIVFDISLNQTGITSFVRTPKYFIFGYKSGEIQFFNHREFEDTFIQNIELQNLKAAKIVFEKNIFLMTHRATKKVYELWLEKKDTIVNLMSNGLIEKAQEIAEDFLFHPKCKKEMEELEELQPDLVALNRYIRSLAYNPAYELAESKPSLKKTLLFDRLEDIWKKALQKAQILLSRDPILNIELAKETLIHFQEVETKKPLIESMLKNAKVFTRAEHAIKNKNFRLYYKLVKEFYFLEYTPLYHKVSSLADQIKMNVLGYLKNDDYMKALESLKLLAQFSPLQESAKKLEEFVNSLIVIHYHVQNNKFLEAIKIQNNLRIQATYKPIQQLNKMKIEYMKKVFSKIQEHKFEDAYNSIKDFFSIKICIRETSMMMKQLYIEQMYKALSDMPENINWEESIKKYGEYFNIDKLLEDFYKLLESDTPLETYIESKQIKKRDFVKNILIYKTN